VGKKKAVIGANPPVGVSGEPALLRPRVVLDIRSKIRK
jgi:hypothetical protein